MSKDFYKFSILPYAGIITKICRAYTNTPEDFEDYYQEVCLQIWRSRANFKEQSEWSTWIYKITLNVCLTLLKKKRIQVEYLDKTSTTLVESTTQSSLNQDNLSILYNAIRTLSEIDRAIILLYLEEKSYKDIAAIMGTNTTNIGVKINRIKKRLKKLLDGKIN